MRSMEKMTVKKAREILCITELATLDDVKKSYRELAKKHHPDFGGDDELMQELNHAYRTILKGKFGVEWDYADMWWKMWGNDPIMGNN